MGQQIYFNTFMLTDTCKGVSSQFFFVRVHSYFVKWDNLFTNYYPTLISLLFGIIGVVGGGVVGIWITEELSSVWRVANITYSIYLQPRGL